MTALAKIEAGLRAIGYRIDQLREDQPRITALDDDQMSDPNGHVGLLAARFKSRQSTE